MQSYFYLIIYHLSIFKRNLFKILQFRIDELKNLYEQFFQKSEIINIIESVNVDLDTELGMIKFKNFNKDSIINGYEGIMIKDPEYTTNVKDQQHG